MRALSASTAAVPPSATRRLRSRRLIGVFAGVVLVLAACGGDDDGDAADPTTATTIEATETETTPSGDTSVPATEPTDDSEPADDTPPADETTAPDETEPEPTNAPATDAPSGDDDVYDVCGLATLEDLESLFGSPFDPGSATHDGETTGGDQCVWSNTDAPPVKIVSVNVLRQDHLGDVFEEAGIELSDLFEETKEFATEPEDLALGEKAYISGSGIEVFADDTIYSISISGTSDEAIAGLRSFAELVLANAGV